MPGQTCDIATGNMIGTCTYTAQATFTLSATEPNQALVHFTASTVYEPPGATCEFEETSAYTKL